MIATTVSPFFKDIQSPQPTTHQWLYEDLLDAAMRQYGVDVYYVQRNYVNTNGIYGEDDQSSYTTATLIAAYVKNVMGFAGDRDFMSKFAGLEIRDQVTFTITRRMFHYGIGDLPVPKGKLGEMANRPREGDLIWFPLNKRCYQIKYVDLYSMFFQVGKLMAWDCTCELFEYSQEYFNTGVPGIDRMMTVSLNVLSYALTDGQGNYLLTEANDYLTTENYVIENIDKEADNTDMDTEANTYISWSEDNPFNDFTTQTGMGVE
jgi:hypothetical protein